MNGVGAIGSWIISSMKKMIYKNHTKEGINLDSQEIQGTMYLRSRHEFCFILGYTTDEISWISFGKGVGFNIYSSGYIEQIDNLQY